jgi:hypothetical protein
MRLAEYLVRDLFAGSEFGVVSPLFAVRDFCIVVDIGPKFW